MYKIIFSLLATLAVAHSAVAVEAAKAGKWVEGKDYFLVEPAQTTNTGDKIEVLEVFSYGCPHCADYQPTADKMQKSLPANAQWLYMPADFQPGWPIYARAYYTAQALGIFEKSHQALLNAIYVTHTVPQKLNSIDDLGSFYADYGVKAQDFIDTAKSFAIDTKVKRASAMQKAYGVESTPSFIVNGKYRVRVGADTADIVQYLVARESGAAK
ncbi:thiol:disulfide interchange protein DsbA/DsbL [Pseudolysobacter antarcticus]|uniref:Thiol:disulfide interchange protein n=1 Tax=Pseudolysobacter antarcticus TaxID=2511995 RepID=A0A411HNY2_9GAMM|nr:thiol:disulfide interchange protein DsbA/DsbL [Pseudolysobacter antarcticus]QBB72172.1 thiol:disulfide interchange protein DsbA/DsbL [Pseudolysobacter antarcticus]